MSFRRIEPGRAVRITVDGASLTACEGESVAHALLAAGRLTFGARTAAGAPATPYCLMGTCFGCLCVIDGRAGEQACMTPALDKMVVETSRP